MWRSIRGVTRLGPCIAPLLVGSCSDHPATQVVVQLYVAPDLAGSATRLRVVVENDDKVVVLDRNKSLSSVQDRVARIPLVPKDEDASRRFVLRAELFDGSDKRIGRIEARAGYTEDELRTLNLTFSKICADRACEDGRTCYDGVCVGSCYQTGLADSTSPNAPSCGECERCGVRCESVDGLACGCPGESCSASECVPKDSVASLAAGWYHSCAALDSDALYCWGTSDVFGRLGAGPGVDSDTPRLVSGVLAGSGVAAAGNTTCSLHQGSRYCWGENDYGEIGNGMVWPEGTYTSAPELVPNAEQLTMISTRSLSFCGVAEGGSSPGALYCWGRNENGQIGTGAESKAVTPPHSVGTGYAQVGVGDTHTCALRLDGALECWGHNDFGQLGTGTGDSSSPVRPGCEAGNGGQTCFQDWVRVATGANHSCGIRAGGRMYCWGQGASGQLGIGNLVAIETVREPQLVASPVQWAEVYAGVLHTCALDRDRSLYCWGDNRSRQLGVPGLDRIHVPTRVEVYAPGGWRAISGGYEHTCGVKANGTLYCWGHNDRGQLGLGSRSQVLIERPSRVCF